MKNNNCGIYAIINTVNQKIYIGQTVNFKNRKRQHFSELRLNQHGKGSKKGNRQTDHLQKSYNKYGECIFEWKILEYCKEEKLVEREQYYIDKYNSANPHCGYNLSIKAHRSVISPEGIERIRKLATGRLHTEETKKRLSLIHKGRKFSEERKLILRKYTQLEKEWIELRKQGLCYAEIGRRYNVSGGTVINYLSRVYFESEEEKKVIRHKISSKNSSKYKHTEETLNKLRGKKPSIETLRKMSLSQRKYTKFVDDWRELKKIGLNYCSIAKQYNVSHHEVIKYLEKYYPVGEPYKRQKSCLYILANHLNFLPLQALFISLKMHTNKRFKSKIEKITEKKKKIHCYKYEKYITEWKELKNQGLSYRKIAKRYNTNHHAVKTYLEKHCSE